MQLVDTCRCDVTNKPRTFIQMNFLMRKVRQHGGRFYVSKHTITITAASKIRSFYDCFCCFVRLACHVWGHAQTQTATQQYPLTQQEHTKHGNFDRSPPPYMFTLLLVIYTPNHSRWLRVNFYLTIIITIKRKIFLFAGVCVGNSV